MIMTIAIMNIIMNITMVIMILMIIMIVNICACIGLSCFLSVATNERCETYHCIDWVLKWQLSTGCEWIGRGKWPMKWVFERTTFGDMNPIWSSVVVSPNSGILKICVAEAMPAAPGVKIKRWAETHPALYLPMRKLDPDRNFSGGSSARNLLVGGISTMLHGFPRMIVLWIAGVVV